MVMQSLRESSADLHSIVIPVIRLSTDVQQDAHVYLLEDGLSLWKATLHHAKQATPEILELFVAIPSLFGKLSSSTRTRAIMMIHTSSKHLIG